jgi:hypothetical protein
MDNNKREIRPAQAGVSGEPNDLAQAPPAQSNQETKEASAGGCLPRPCSALSPEPLCGGAKSPDQILNWIGSKLEPLGFTRKD